MGATDCLNLPALYGILWAHKWCWWCSSAWCQVQLSMLVRGPPRNTTTGSSVQHGAVQQPSPDKAILRPFSCCCAARLGMHAAWSTDACACKQGGLAKDSRHPTRRAAPGDVGAEVGAIQELLHAEGRPRVGAEHLLRPPHLRTHAALSICSAVCRLPCGLLSAPAVRRNVLHAQGRPCVGAQHLLCPPHLCAYIPVVDAAAGQTADAPRYSSLTAPDIAPHGALAALQRVDRTVAERRPDRWDSAVFQFCWFGDNPDPQIGPHKTVGITRRPPEHPCGAAGCK